MVLTWSEIVKLEGSSSLAYEKVKERKYKRVSHGVYVDNGELVSELEQLFVRYPRATLTMQSAFDYYELSDYVPEKYYLATPYNSHTISNPKVYQTYMDEDIIQVGRVKVKTNYGFIYIFDKERMLIELFRLKSKLPHAYFLEVVASYRVLKAMEVISIRKVSEYCQRLKNGAKILKEIQEMI